jgi:hypothetical protein
VLTGSERVAIIEVPAGSDRWEQVGIGKQVADHFFRLSGGRKVLLQRVATDGAIAESNRRGLVNPESNKNHRMEFSIPGDYPTEGKPQLVVVEESSSDYRYSVLMPRDPGYDEVESLNQMLPKFGGGLKRSVTTLTELERVWTDCPIRSGP